MLLNRRHFLTSSLKAMGAAALLPLPFQLSVAKAADGFIEFTAMPASQKLYNADAPASDLWTYNGQTPGPEIRVKRGERVKVRLINNLPEPTSIHWHGIRIDNAMDGVSGLTQEPAQPGETFEYDFVVPDAGTYWFHAHHRSWNQVARGLYGALIVEENEDNFDAEHDLTLVLDDWRLTREGALDTESLGSMMDWSHGGRLGNWLTINGKSLPNFSLNANEAYRLRLINAANSRVLELDPNDFGAKILAFDGQALPEPITLSYAPLLLAPAQRVDLLVVPKAGEDFTLKEMTGGDGYPFAGFKIIDKGSKLGAIPVLSSNNLPEPDVENARTVRIHMTGGAMGQMGDIVYKGEVLEGSRFRDTGQVWALNGVANLADEPLFQAKRGETIILETLNDTAFMHAMHTHGHHFRIIERVGSDVDEGKPWRDTFLVGIKQTTRVAFVADNPGKWLLHCHMLEHAAAGMNTWFEVI
ncbi:MAG: multicopper oxidase family protein [Rhizobiales bacterium]|nr:multicopper oxidase family protein [Hyphomicrobiales bacterium]